VENIFVKSVPWAFVYNVSHPNLNINGSGVAERFPGAVIRTAIAWLTDKETHSQVLNS